MSGEGLVRARADEWAEFVALHRREAAESVDTLHLAARLESTGYTDETARRLHDRADVFTVARDLRADVRAPAVPDATRAPEVPGTGAIGPARIFHGVLYLLPTLVLPACLDLASLSAVLVGLVVGGGLGWIWTAGMSWTGYHWHGLERREQAMRSQLVGLLTGIALALAAGLVVSVFQGGLSGALATVVAVYQMAVAVLALLDHWVVVFIVMAPPAVLGVLHLSVELSPRSTRWTMVLAVSSVALLAGLALALLVRGGGWRRTSARLGRADLGRGMVPVTVYAALSAAFLISAQADFLLRGLAVAVGMVGLVVTMGVVEWRSASFRGRTRAILEATSSVAAARHRVRLALVREAAVCALATAVSGLVLAIALNGLDRLSTSGLMVIVACLPLAAAYVLAMIAANLRRNGLLIVAFGIALASQGVTSWAGVERPTGFLVAATVLLVLLLGGLTTARIPLRTYR